MGKIPVTIKLLLFVFFAGLVVLVTLSGYLYRENKVYRNDNYRLIIQNDSILSENIELKNALQQKQSAAIKRVGETNKVKEHK